MRGKHRTWYRRLSLAVVASAMIACGDDDTSAKPDGGSVDAAKDTAVLVDSSTGSSADVGAKPDLAATTDTTVDAPKPNTDVPVAPDAPVDTAGDAGDSDAAGDAGTRAG